MGTAAPATSDSSTRSVSELSQIVVGSPMSLNELWDFLGDDAEEDARRDQTTITVGSVGYERFKSSTDFAETLARHGVERVIDVRELPISRKRGFAKTALADALQERGIEYVHEKGLGNPKEYRDLYKAGNTELGRAGYTSFLLEERMEALRELVPLLEAGRAALMCVEHDTEVCHRDVIFDALRDQLGLSLIVNQLDSES